MMAENSDKERQIDPARAQRESWSSNAAAWTEAIRGKRIESRRVGADQAIVDAIVATAPRRVLDLGCGEGWLCRVLQKADIETIGIDASPELIASARQGGEGVFEVCSFDEIAADPGRWGRFDCVVCNFSLLDEDLQDLMGAIPEMLTSSGSFILQTVHPLAVSRRGPYVSQWKEEDFSAFGTTFPARMPWYFRTLSDWFTLLSSSGLHVVEVREPVHPDSGEPLSLILRACPAPIPLPIKYQPRRTK